MQVKYRKQPKFRADSCCRRTVEWVACNFKIFVYNGNLLQIKNLYKNMTGLNSCQELIMITTTTTTIMVNGTHAMNTLLTYLL